MKRSKYFGPICMILSAFLAISVAQPLKATSISEEQQKQDDLHDSIESAEQIIKDLESLKSDTEAYIKEMDARMESLTNYIIDLNQQIATKEEEIQALNVEIADQEVDIAEQYDDMKVRIKYMYENGQAEYIDMLMNSKNISEMLNKAEYLSKITEYDRNMLQKMKDTLAAIEANKQQLEKEQNELNTLKAETEDEQAEVERLVEEKKSLLIDTTAQIEAQEAAIEKMEADIAESEAVVADIIEAERRAQEAERRRQEEAAKAAAAAGNSGSTSGTAGSTGGTEIYTGGALLHPLPGYTYISSGYYHRINPVTGQPENHKGIDFPAPAGTPIVAAASGTVAWAYRSSSAGNWVGIAHGNGLTTVYMHMSAYCVSEGDVVSAGQVIGYVGSTGQSTGNHLHFAIKVNGEYVNPMNYIG